MRLLWLAEMQIRKKDIKAMGAKAAIGTLEDLSF